MKQKKRKPYYMHTLNREPAGFFDGRSVCFSSSVTLCDSLRQLRREQAISKRNDGGRISFEYGYQRVYLP
jgi:hypothetical protein